ncbi:MAG: hypothetical protein HGA19_05995 [Oscillochloris sp.]|nr:hypothetical protein [Oscillochloris sp.]
MPRVTVPRTFTPSPTGEDRRLGTQHGRSRQQGLDHQLGALTVAAADQQHSYRVLGDQDHQIRDRAQGGLLGRDHLILEHQALLDRSSALTDVA